MCYPLMFPFVLSQPWGLNKEFYEKIGMKGHNGWDFSCVVGTPVYATHDGKVDFAGIDGTDSKTIAIDTLQEYDHEGQKVKFRTMYAHLSEYFVAPGQMVKRGEKIGLTGNTGRYTTGPHLHFGIKPIINYSPIDVNNGYNGAIDPSPYLPEHQEFTKTLALGDVGDEVAKLQAFLLRNGYMKPVKQLGFYGEITAKAILDFQIKNVKLSYYERYVLRGRKVGPKTLTALNKY